MNRSISVSLAAVLLCGAAPAAARTADYGKDEAQFANDAFELEVSSVPTLPSRGQVDVVADDLQALDHELKVLGLHCSLWDVENPLSQMVSKALGAWDSDGELGDTDRRPLIRLTFKSARSTMRCVEVEELDGRCLVRTSIEAEARIDQGADTLRVEPVSINVEHEQAEASCSIARGTALSGRSASIALVERLRDMVAP